MTTRMTPPSRRASPNRPPSGTSPVNGADHRQHHRCWYLQPALLTRVLWSHQPGRVGLATVGSVALAFMFAVMSRRMPADGGPFDYARSAFGNSLGFAIGGAMAICLFSYLGVETAAVAAAKVRDPERNVPRSTIYGTLASAVVYLLSMIAVFGIVPTSDLALDANKASYSTAANTIIGSGSWAGDLVAIAVIISGIGALNGWTMICAEMPLAAAKDGLFHNGLVTCRRDRSRPSGSSARPSLRRSRS
jgi:amino acid transporter